MHPVERLRYVARSGGVDHATLAAETAHALAGFAGDPAGLVTACRRILARHPYSGPLWSLCARVLAAADPRQEAFDAARAIEEDPTPAALGYHLPDDATVVVLGWPEQVAGGLIRRGDVRALVVDVFGEGAGLCLRLDQSDNDVAEVRLENLGAAVAHASLVVLEATAMGPDAFVGVVGSSMAAAVAAQVGTPVWLVVGEGRVLSAPLYEEMVGRLAATTDPLDADEESVRLDAVEMVVGPRGLESIEAMLRAANAPVVPELLKKL